MTMLQTSSHPPMATTKPQRETAWLQRHALLGYSLLAYGWSWLGMVGMALALQFNFVPADSPRLGLINQVAAFGPAMAALIVIARTEGFTGVGVWLRRLVQWRVGIQWYLFALFGIPLLMLIGESVVHGMRPFQALAQQWPLLFTHYLPYVALTTLATGLAEEPGWRGFAQPQSMGHCWGHSCLVCCGPAGICPIYSFNPVGCPPLVCGLRPRWLTLLS